MTLYKLIKVIKQIAANIPNISFIHDGDVYELNKRPDIEYPAIVISQSRHIINSIDGIERYGLNIFAIDRLTSDSSNRLDIQSWANEVLKLIIRTLEENELCLIYDEVVIQPFTERFESLCAGCYAELQIQISEDECDGKEIIIKI